MIATLGAHEPDGGRTARDGRQIILTSNMKNINLGPMSPSGPRRRPTAARRADGGRTANHFRKPTYRVPIWPTKPTQSIGNRHIQRTHFQLCEGYIMRRTCLGQCAHRIHGAHGGPRANLWARAWGPLAHPKGELTSLGGLLSNFANTVMHSYCQKVHKRRDPIYLAVQ